MKTTKILWLLVLGVALTLGAGTVLAAPEAGAENPVDQTETSAVAPDATACLTLQTQEPLPDENPDEVPPECELDPDLCCELYPDAPICGNNVWCCKPVNNGTDRKCQKIPLAKCNKAPAGVVHPSEGACKRAC